LYQIELSVMKKRRLIISFCYVKLREEIGFWRWDGWNSPLLLTPSNLFVHLECRSRKAMNTEVC